MGYRIAYDRKRSYKFPLKTGKKMPTKWIITGALLMGLLAGGWKLLLPGDSHKTQIALTHLAQNVRAGESVGQAITAFCQEIIENAK